MKIRHAGALWLSLPALVLLAVPFITLTGVTHW
ncbi:MAG: sulfate ABC transporter permease, partial [Pantoea sp. Morm]|nr:sulfate ABC transporter permease [Pantoea sp. Morm]